jgi:hypothetical protein
MTSRMSYEDALSRLGGGRGPWHCPAHDDRSESLGLICLPDGSALPTCFTGCSRADVFAALRGQPIGRAFGLAVDVPDERDETPRLEFARKLWREARPAAGTLAERYLLSRGINIIPSTIRFSNLKHPSGVTLPAMICAVMDIGDKVTAVHRTYLDRDGNKADVKPVKMALGPCRGNAVHLAHACPTLCITEGIETGLSILQATGLPTWVCLGTAGLKALELPEAVTEVVIAADGDKAGLKAAYAAARQFIRLDRKVRMARPRAGYDFNDLLKAG